MTKELFLARWGSIYIYTPNFKSDIKALIANEIAKVQEAKLKHADQVIDQVTDQKQPALNPIEQAYHNYEPIRYKKWEKFQWIKKHSEFEAKTENGAIFNVVSLSFNTHPEKWELYTEHTKQPTLNPIAEAYERGEKIRLKDWRKSSYIKKQSKKQFIDERGSTLYHHNILGFDTHPEKWELYTEPTDQVIDQVTDQKQPALNPIEQAYERGEKIRLKTWQLEFWIQKYDNTRFIDCNGHKKFVKLYNFKKYPHAWELYTEPETPAKPFDKDRFEAMFQAVYQTTKSSDFNLCVKFTKEILTELDAYYASKEGGNND